MDENLSRYLLRRCEHRFGVSVKARLHTVSASLVFAAISHDGTPTVLKLGLNDADLVREVEALKAFIGRGAIGVLDFDAPLGALMLQRAVPGTPLSAFDDDAATEIFCSVFLRLHSGSFTGAHQSIQEHFSAIAQYRQRCRAEAACGPLPLRWVDRAAECLKDLVSSTRDPLLLHGDLHHDNILRYGDGWVVIDPKGIVGDWHFDVVQYLLNHQSRGGSPDAVLARRITMMTDRRALDPQRIAMWGISKGILDACWTIEGGGDGWQSAISAAERFDRLLV